MPGNISNLEIFAAGKHNASTGAIDVTEADLDQIVEAFSALTGTNIVKPHLKLGHTDAQKWFGQKDGIPTLGWIDRVWRNGKKLLADISNVPDGLLTLLKQGRYHNVSAEVYFDAPIKHNGKNWPRVLSAVSLLGVEMPAVKDLAGLANALFAEKLPSSVEGAEVVSIKAQEKPMPGENSAALFTQEQVETLSAAAAEKAVTEFKASSEATITELKAENADLKSRAEQAEAEIKKVKASAATAAAETLVNDAIKAGKLLPKQKDFAMSFMTSGSMLKFGEGEKSMPELFKEFLDAAGAQIETGEKGSGKTSQQEFATAAEEVDTKTRELMERDGKLTYSTARNKVLASNAELKSRYALGVN